MRTSTTRSSTSASCAPRSWRRTGPGGGHFPAAVADAGLLSTLTALSAALGTSSGTSIRPGFDTGTVPANDDGSVGPVPLGFTANFFGVNRDTVFVNNNGNLTLD